MRVFSFGDDMFISAQSIHALRLHTEKAATEVLKDTYKVVLFIGQLSVTEDHESKDAAKNRILWIIDQMNSSR